MKIRIIAPPPSSVAPNWVRQAWVGILLPSSGRESPNEGMQLRIGNKNVGGYRVSGSEALQALATHNAKAHDWWLSHVPLAGIDLIFKAEVCEELPD